MRHTGLRGTSIVPEASRLDPFCCDIGTRSFDLDPLTHIVADGDPHCFGFLINDNDVRYGPHVDSALVGLPGHLKVLSAPYAGTFLASRFARTLHISRSTHAVSEARRRARSRATSEGRGSGRA